MWVLPSSLPLGVENPELGGILGGAFAAPTQRQRPPQNQSSEAGKVAAILGPSIAIESTSRNESLPLVLLPRTPCVAVSSTWTRDAIQMAIDQYPIFKRIPEGPLSITCSTIRIAAANARGDGSLGTSFEAYFSRSQLNAQPRDARERPT